MRLKLARLDLTNYVGSLSRAKLAELSHALRMALDLSELLSAGNTQKKPFYPSFASALEPFHWASRAGF
jgi:hypothetical protein